MTTELENKKVDFDKYAAFVNEVTSFPSKSDDEFVRRIQALQEQEVPISRLLTAAVGITAEGGEFTEIVKKIAFQGKEPQSAFAIAAAAAGFCLSANPTAFTVNGSLRLSKASRIRQNPTLLPYS